MVIEMTKTKSLCPVCLSELEADLELRNGSVFLKKTCPEHGNQSFKITDYGLQHLELRNYYFTLFKNAPVQDKYLLVLTEECNLACPICYLKRNSGSFQKIEYDELSRITKNIKAEIIIYAAEPTCDGRLFDVIKLLRKHQKSVSLYSNGINLADFDYALKLKRAGIGKIILQFDGFNDEIYKIIRGRGLLDIKMQALNNLKKLGMPVILDVTVMKDVNESEVKNIMDYALENNFIKGVTYIGFFSPMVSDYKDSGLFMMPDDIIGIIQRQTQGKIHVSNINRLQKVLYNYMLMFNKRLCFYLKYYWVFRSKTGFSTIDDMLSLDKTEPILEKLRTAHAHNKKVRIFLLRIGLFMSLMKNIKSWGIFRGLFLLAITHSLFNRDHNIISDKILQIDFSTGCDPYRIDYKIVPHCSIGYIYKDAAGNVRVNTSAAPIIKDLKSYG